METVAEAFPEGPRYHLSTRWFNEWTTWFYGSQDRKIHSWIVRHARPDWVAFDVGMNFGYYACLLAQRSAAVHGFEPVPWLANRARSNVKLNGFRNVSIVEVALSEHPGKATLNLPPEDDTNWGRGSLVHQCGGNTLEIALDSIDNYVDHYAIDRVDFIKIDVEGAEHLTLKGAIKTLKRYRPTIIFERNTESVRNVVDLLQSFGYSFSDLIEGASEVRVTALGNDVTKWPIDVLAVSKALP
jgi:FkbM family methyltransferase